MQFTTKDRTQCLINDQFLITKKLNMAAMPDPASRSAQVSDPSTFETVIEKSA